MKTRYIFAGIVVFAIWHALCHFLNWYFEIWWTDIVAHVIAGIVAGMIGWRLLEKSSQTRFMTASNIVAFSTTISVFWEFWEFSNWRYVFLRNIIGHIQKQFYPYWGNNLGDIFWGLAGGCLVAGVYLWLSSQKSL